MRMFTDSSDGKATMATVRDSRTKNALSPQRDHRVRWTSTQFQELVNLGFFGSRRVELLDGEIWEKMTTDPPHAICVELLTGLLPAVFGEGFRLRICLPLDLGRRSQPEPDFAILPGHARDAMAHPKIASLVIEISDATLRKDRTLKAHLYARAGIADYWIVNLPDRRLEVHRHPAPNPERKGRFLYREITLVPADGHASPLARPESRIGVADLLP